MTFGQAWALVYFGTRRGVSAVRTAGTFCVICGESWALAPRRTDATTCSPRCRVAKHRADELIKRITTRGTWRGARLPRPNRSTIARAVIRYVELGVTAAGGPPRT